MNETDPIQFRVTAIHNRSGMTSTFTAYAENIAEVRQIVEQLHYTIQSVDILPPGQSPPTAPPKSNHHHTAG